MHGWDGGRFNCVYPPDCGCDPPGISQLQKTGMFEVICAACLRMSRGNLLVVSVLLCCITAFMSAWLDNVTTMLLMAPMTMSVFEAVGRNPVPLLLAQVMPRWVA